jgi:SET domain-containing protein
MYKVKRSHIHGRGLFASEFIPAGTFLGQYAGPEVKRNGAYVLWVEEDDGVWRGIAGRNALRYVNHSTTPNAEFVGPQLHAIEAVAPGAEITVDYGPEFREALER